MLYKAVRNDVKRAVGMTNFATKFYQQFTKAYFFGIMEYHTRQQEKKEDLR